jgi:hypothetical protein
MSTARHVGRILSAWGFPVAVALAVIAALFEHTSVSQSINDLAYDRFVRLDSRLNRVPAHVLLVYADRELDERPDDYWQLLRQLRRLGAAGVGIAELDVRGWTPEQLQRLALWTGLAVGHVVGDERKLPDQLKRASLALVNSADGVYRRCGGLTGADGRASLVAQVAKSFGGESPAVPHGDFGVRFCGPAESLPHVSANEFLGGEITAALVRDRVVLIGRPSDVSMPGLATPTTAGERMSVLECHGHALNTLLASCPIRTLEPRLQCSLYLLAAIVFPCIIRRLPMELAIPLFLAAWAIQALVVLLLLWRTQVWIPLVTLMNVELLAGLFAFDRRLRFAERAWQTLRRRGFHVSPRYQNPPGLQAGKPPWSYVTTMAQQLFPLDNVALLLARSGRVGLRLVACTAEHELGVLECRHQLLRRPFAESLRRRAAVRIDRDRPFFKSDETQAQYFTPLFHAGQFKGALIAEMSSTANDRLPGIARQLTELGEEIAGWLAAYEKLATADVQQRRWWMRWATPDEVFAFDGLQTQLHTIERHSHQTNQVIENASFGQAVFDLSGAVVTMNATMYRLLHACKIAPIESQLLQIIRSLTRRDMWECREMIRRVVMAQQHERVVVAGPSNQQSMVLVVQPSFRCEQLVNHHTELHTFNVQGIHVELFPGDLLGEIHDVCQHVAQQTLAAVDNTLEAVSSRSAQLSAPIAPRSWDEIQTLIEQARVTIQRCQSMLANGQSEEMQVHVPVNLATIVKAAVNATCSMAEQRNITIAQDVSRDLPDVVANPHRLRQIISAAIHVMVEHARENSLVHIYATTDAHNVLLTIDNEGCGVALDRLTSVRCGPTGQQPTKVSRLLELRQWVVGWGGDLWVDADHGEGASIGLNLQHFDWSGPCGPAASSDVQCGRLV